MTLESGQETATPQTAATPEPDKTEPAKQETVLAGEGTEPEKAADPLAAVPEDGKYEITLPDGMTVDQPMIEALSPVMKEAGVTAGQAQKLAAAFASYRAKEAENWHAQVEKWAVDARADAEIGGAKWDASVAAAKRAVDRFGGDELKAFLNETGAGNHPAVIRAFVRAGMAISEDNPESGSKANPKKGDALSALYPDDQPKGT